MRIPETGDYYAFKQAILDLPFTVADERVRDEHGMVLHDGTAQLEWIPLRAGTLRGWIETGAEWEDGQDVFKRVGGRVMMFDDMDGHLLVDGKVVGTIDYIKGEMNFPANEYRHSEYWLEYFFDSSPSANNFAVTMVEGQKLTLAFDVAPNPF